MQNTLPEQFFQTAEKNSQRPALRYKKDGTWFVMTFKEVESQIKNFAAGLSELGCQKKDKLAILSENRPEWVVADLATMSIGAVVVPVHKTLSAKLTAHVLKDSGARFLVVSDQEQLNEVLLHLSELDDLRVIIYLDLDAPEEIKIEQKLLAFDEVIKLGKKNQSSVSNKPAADDVCSIIYTSGTTGLPKGVMLTHKNFLSNAAAALKRVPISQKDTLLSFLPLSHVLERMAGYYASFVLSGACIAYAQSPKTLVDDLKQIKPTVLVSVPRIFERVHKSVWEKVKQDSNLKRKLFIKALKQKKGTLSYKIFDFLVFKKIRSALGGRFRLTISGGASLNPMLGKFFDKVGIMILEGYGLTETSPVIAVNQQGQVKFGTVGQVLPNLEVKIAADKEILVRGPSVMKGYYKNEEETRQVIDQEGWFHTGDLGFIDQDGYLTIIGRKKEMIVLASGKNAWPESIEYKLEDDRFVSQAMVLGQSKNFISALIVPDWQEIKRYCKEINLETQSPEALVKHPKIINLFKTRIDNCCKDNAKWERPKKFALLESEFSQERDELTPTLKLRRKVIEGHYRKEIDVIYS